MIEKNLPKTIRVQLHGWAIQTVAGESVLATATREQCRRAPCLCDSSHKGSVFLLKNEVLDSERREIKESECERGEKLECSCFRSEWD